MSARERILSRLRAAQQPFGDLGPISERRRTVPWREMTGEERLEQFRAEAEKLGCKVYRLGRGDALEQMMELIGGDGGVLAWDDDQLPIPGLREMLRSLGVSVRPHNDGEARVGITGVSAALAATGSLVLESGAGRHRGSSLLPDVHIALLRPEQLLPDMESWQEAQRARGYPAFRESSNTVIVTGPSKTADIGHQLVKGAHGPREVHVLIVE